MDIRQCIYNCFLVIFLLHIHCGLCISIEDDYEDGPSFGRCPWIRNKLKNGRVRYRYKGRVAKFLCDSGYELAGKRSSTCVRGQWSNPIPVCVARGCSRVPSIPNGRVTEMYRGALLVYDCNPGYVLEGEGSIHCDGRRWSTSPPACGTAAEKPETFCDFESPDLCGWSHDPNHDFDWKRNQFSTPSGHVGTGPSYDHTFGENKGGFYLYIEASSPRKINDTARLFSPVYPPDLSGGCFLFWYHMYGATTGGLRVYLKPESHVFDELKPNWEKFGDQGNQWLRGRIIVPVLHENFQIVIEGIRGESYVGDSAIDDVRLTNTTCEISENDTESREHTVQDSCRGRCREAESDSSCGCNDNCFAVSNCCSDYLTICGAGNDTSSHNTDEPLPGDYFDKTTSSSAVTSSTTASKVTEEQEATVSSKPSSELTTNTPVSSTSTVSSSSPTTPLSSTISLSTTPVLVTSPKTSSSTTIVTKLSTTTKKPTTTSVTVSTTTSKPATSAVTTQSTKTTEFISTSVPSTTPSTTTSTTPLKTTVTSTTSAKPTSSTTVRTTTQSSTLPTTTFSSTLLILTSIIPSSLSTTVSSTLSSSTTTLKSTASFTTKQSTTVPTSSYKTTLSSTRKTYNLRPRTQRTTASSSTISTTSTIVSTTNESTALSNTPINVTLSSPRVTSGATHSITSTTSSSAPSTSSTVSTKTTTVSTTKLTTASSHTTPQTAVRYVPPTAKRPYQISTQTSPDTTSSSYESGASEAETAVSNSSGPVVISIIVIVILCVVVAVVYYLRKQRSKRQSKLSDDSEMRFLPESEYMEYSDASALDKILIK